MTTSSGGGVREVLQGDDMVLSEDMYTLVKHVARQLCMTMNHLYDKQGGSKTADQNGEY